MPATREIRYDGLRDWYDAKAAESMPSSREALADESFDAFAAIWSANPSACSAPGGVFVFYGVHPCFNGPGVEPCSDGTVVVHPIYREARRHLDSPWWGRDGIRHRVGGMRHVLLTELLNPLLAAGLRLTHVVEPRGDPIPVILGITAHTPHG